jgi:sugar phosphate permease
MIKRRYLTNTKASILVFAALLSTFTFISMTKSCFSSAMAFIVEEGIMTKSQTGTIVAVFYLIYGFLQLVGGILTDKWNPERFITFGFIGAGLCNLAVYFNQSFTFVIVVWVLNACAQFAVWPAVFKICSSMLKEEHRSTALFLISYANSLGIVINYAVAALIPHWKINFLISAIGLIAFALLWEILVRSVRPYIEEKMVEAPTTPVHTHYHEKQKNISFISLMVASGMLLFLVVYLTRAIFDNGLKTLVATMINENYDNVTPAVATALSIIILVMGALGPTLAHQIYPRFVKNEITATIILFLAGTPFGVLLLLTGKVHYWWIVVFLSFFILLMNSTALFTNYIAARFNKWGKSATLAGAFNMMSALGIVISNFVFTRVVEAFNWHVTIWVWVVLLIIANILLWVIAPMWKKFLRTHYYEHE